MEVVKTWPKFSGDPEFPVPHPSLTGRAAYLGEPDLWAGTYGDNRRELLAWVLSEQPVLTEKPALPKKIYAIPKL